MTETETGWLIEGKAEADQPIYIRISGAGIEMTLDHGQAMRFAREKDALDMIAWIDLEDTYGALGAVEHNWTN